MASQLTYGELCSGVGGLSMAIEEIFNAEPAFHCEFDDAPRKVLEARWPDVPLYRDVKALNWEEMPRVDILGGGYPCFVAGTLVRTLDGHVPIEQVKSGDWVMTHERRFGLVNALMSKDADSTVRVKAMGADDIVCTANHPFYVRKKLKDADIESDRAFTEPEWVAASDLTKDHYVALPLTLESDIDASHNPMSLDEIYFWGRYVGDGWYKRTQRSGRKDSWFNNVYVACNADKLEKLKPILDRLEWSYHVPEMKTCSRVTLSGKAKVEVAMSFGKGAHNKKLPDWVFKLSIEQKREFLQGYLDADGHRDGDSVSFTTTSHALAIDVLRLAREVHETVGAVRKVEVTPTKVIQGRTVNQRPYFRGTVSLNGNSQAFIEKGFGWAPVRSVATEGGAKVYNIAVSGDESYTANGVVVHNCQPFSLAGKRKAQDDERHLWPYIYEGVKALQPAYVYFENVYGHLSKGLSDVLLDLNEAGYKVAWGVQKASDVGAPHERKRVFIMGKHEPDAKHVDGLVIPISRGDKMPKNGLAINGGYANKGDLVSMFEKGTNLPTPLANSTTGAWHKGREGGKNLQTVVVEFKGNPKLFLTPCAAEGVKGTPQLSRMKAKNGQVWLSNNVIDVAEVNAR